MQQWHEDIRMARNTFRDNLVEDSLSARCVAILDRIVKDDRNNGDLFQDVQLDQSSLNSFPWSMETNELFNSFDWDLGSQTF
jgi:transcriptional regulatory protein GAL4